MSSSGSIVFDAGGANPAVIRRGMRRQSNQVVVLDKTERNTQRLFLGGEPARLFVISTNKGQEPEARQVGVGATYVPITSPPQPGQPFRGRLISPRFYLVYTTENISVRQFNSIIQAYQVPLILPVPQTIGSSSGCLGQPLGTISTGGFSNPVVTLFSINNSPRSTIGAPGDLLLITEISQGANAFTIEQDGVTYPGEVGLIFDLGTRVFFRTTGTTQFTALVYRPIRVVGAIGSATNATVAFIRHNGNRYRLGDSYTGSQRYAKNLTIQGVDYLATPEGFGL